MELQVKRYSSEDVEVWDKFVESTLNGTFLHTRKFFLHNPINNTDDHSLLFLKKGRIIALLPAALYLKDDTVIFHSHPRATYGGFVVNEEVGVETATDIVGLAISYAKEQNAKEMIVRNPFRIFYKQLSDETDYAMWYHGFSIRTREIETAILLGDYATVQQQYDDTTKRSIKKAAKNITIEITEDYRAYWTVLEQNLKRKHGIKPTHSYDQFQNLLSLVGDDKVKLFVAKKEDQVVAGIVVFLSNSCGLHAQYIASDENFQEFRPLNGVIDTIIKWGCENGFRYFNLGTSNTNGGKEINTGLFRFKEGFGGRGILRETMHMML